MPPSRSATPRLRMHGFTLVELVVTLVVVAILAIGVTRFITDSAAGLAMTTTSNQLASAGRAALDRMGVEVAHALPGSMRVSANNQCLEFIPITHATTYLDPGFASAAQEFDAVEFDPALTLGAGSSRYAAIYPLDPAEAYTLSTSGPLAAIDTITDASPTDGKVRIRLQAPQLFPRRSPLARLFVVARPVSFCLAGASLYKYSDYGFQPTAMSCAPACLPPNASGHRSMIADDLLASPNAFAVSAPTLQRNGIASFTLNFGREGVAIALQDQVLVRNVP